MNQILDYNPNKSSGGGSSGSDKIVRVFAIILILFAIVLIGMGGYKLIANKKTEENNVEKVADAEISIDVGAEKITINVNHSLVIEKIIYNWDSDKEKTIQGKGTTTLTEDIPTLAGEHTLNIKVVDVKGNESSYSETVSSESGIDIVNPQIKLEPLVNTLRITATDETEIAFVTYRWNDAEEIKVEDISEDGKTITFEIDLLKGENDLMVIAVDKNGNTTSEPKSFKGVLNPDIQMTVSPDKKIVSVICSHENGLKSIVVVVNGQEYPVGIEEGTKESSFDLQLVDQTSEITVKTESVDNTRKEVTETIEQDASITGEMTKTEHNNGIVHAIVNATNGIKEITLIVNNQEYAVPVTEGDNTVEFDFQIVEESVCVLRVVDMTGATQDITSQFEV